MGNISYAVDVLEGVQTAMAEIGEQATITRRTQMRDPANPTKQITVTEEWTVIGALMGPVSRFDNATQTVRQITQWYTDLLSVQNSVGTYLNTIIDGIPSVTWISKEGDTVTLSDGTEFVLMQNDQPRISGVQVAAFHEVAG